MQKKKGKKTKEKKEKKILFIFSIPALVDFRHGQI
jgi:hypothetical protein